jgi:hypothetical protein
MSIDKKGSYIKEPDISEDSLRLRIEMLAEIITLNEHTAVKRDLVLDQEVDDDINYRRAKKELEASLGHEIDRGMSVSLAYNPRWKTFEPKKLVFTLPGTSYLTAHLEYDPDSLSYSSYLYDSESEQQICRQPVRLSTVDEILHAAGIQTKIMAENQMELTAELLTNAHTLETVSISQQSTIFDEDVDESLSASCYLEREQTYGPDELSDVFRFVLDTTTEDASHARIITVIRSTNGTMLTVEEKSQLPDSATTVQRMVDLDYETIEKLQAQVQKAINSLKTTA